MTMVVYGVHLTHTHAHTHTHIHMHTHTHMPAAKLSRTGSFTSKASKEDKLQYQVNRKTLLLTLMVRQALCLALHRGGPDRLCPSPSNKRLTDC